MDLMYVLALGHNTPLLDIGHIVHVNLEASTLKFGAAYKDQDVQVGDYACCPYTKYCFDL